MARRTDGDLSGTPPRRRLWIDAIQAKAARIAFRYRGSVFAFTGIGRFVFTTDAFAAIDEVERTLRPDIELDDIPVMQRLFAAGRLIGRRILGRFLDVGLPGGYADASELLRSR